MNNSNAAKQSDQLLSALALGCVEIPVNIVGVDVSCTDGRVFLTVQIAGGEWRKVFGNLKYRVPVSLSLKDALELKNKNNKWEVVGQFKRDSLTQGLVVTGVLFKSK